MSNLKVPSKRYVRMSRPHDFLYDPNYIMPSREDFLKDAAFGAKAGARIKLKPVYQSMFSAIKTDARIEPCLTQPMPNNLDNFMPQYDIGGVPVMPMDTGPLPLPREVDDVTGADRAKYAMRYGPPSFHLQKVQFDFNKLLPEEKKKILQTQKTRRSGFISRGMQTTVRESETQTDPFSPPYKLPYPGAYPKVLALIKLTWAKGLPFTLEDIVVIERALSKRLLEHSTRDGDGEEGFEKRIKLMEELEAQQWADREKELEKVLLLKMEITSKLIYEYSAKISTEHTMRLERLQSVIRAKNVRHLENVKHQYFRNLRKLEKKYFDKKPRQETKRRNIIKEYTEFDSNVYAPLLREGTSMDLLNPAPQFQFDLHRDFESFEQLTESQLFIRKELAFDMNAFKDRIRGCGPNADDRRLERKLEKIFTAFRDHHTYKKPGEGDMHDAIAQVFDSKSTPKYAMDEETEESIRKPHCITIQKIARGRVIQKMIRKEIEESMNELLGMKFMFDMDPNCQRLEEGQMQKLIAMKKQTESDSMKDTAVREVLGHLEGETLTKMLDFLDKEMIRLIDERKIHALILLAERERRRKEALEAGRRHREELNRRAHDEIFKQIVGVHQATIDIYLEDIFIESSDRTADETSRNLVRHMATTLNEAAYSMPTDLGDFEKEELAAELVSSFIIPEMSRLCHKEKVDDAGKRYKKAAGQVMDAVFSAHAVSKQIVDGEVPPLVQEHNLRGWAAADGSVSVIDSLIKDAVYEAMKAQDVAAAEFAIIAAKEKLEEETRLKAEQEAEAARLAEEEQKQASQYGVSQIVLQSKKMSLVMGGFDDYAFDVLEEERFGLEPSQLKEDIEVPEEMLQPSDKPSVTTEGWDDDTLEIPEEEALPEKMFAEPSLHVNEQVRIDLAAKSVQVALRIEPCQQAENLFAGLNLAVDELFLEARRQIVPDPEKEDDVEAVNADEDTEDD